jgi:hypothetical protein
MDSSVSAWLYIIILLYIFCIYYSEVDCPNSYMNENSMVASGFKWFFLISIIIIELSIAYSYDYNKNESGTENLKILIAVMFTWFLIFTPTIYLYYYGGKGGGYNGKPSVYLNSIFENVIGYLFVKNEANSIFEKLNIGIFENSTPAVKDMEKIVIEINKSRAIFINQLNIFNFENIWEKLFSHLFAIISGDKENTEALNDIKKQLFALVKKKYIIGKCIWFLYNTIMCLSISLYLLII